MILKLKNIFFNIKYQNILKNSDRYHDKLINTKLKYILNNIYLFLNNIYNKYNNNNIEIKLFIKNDRIFYTGLVILILGIIFNLII